VSYQTIGSWGQVLSAVAAAQKLSCVTAINLKPLLFSLIPRPFPPPILANMEGEVWEIWSRVVTSGRQMVDTRGEVPNHAIPSTHAWHCKQQRCWCCLANILVSSPQMDITREGLEILHPPPLPPAPHVSTIRSPRPSPSVFHTASNQRLEVGIA